MSQYLTATEIMLKGLLTEDKEYLNKNFVVKNINKRGRSVFTKRTFKKGDYVMEYKGSCVKYSVNKFLNTQKVYETNEELSYCLEFYFNDVKYYIDATREFEYGFARLINHARNPNLKLFKPLQVHDRQTPRIAMFAACDISQGEELFWNYFDSLNPVKCLIGQPGREVPKEMQWIFCRRKKIGGVTYCNPRKMISDRSGLCMICYDYKSKLSNHLIQYHKIRSVDKRLDMITKGRKAVASGNLLKKKKVKSQTKRVLSCPMCHGFFKQLPTHLSRIHKIEGIKKRRIVQSSRKVALTEERRCRKKEYLDKQ